jgi:hypothetical protein
LSVRTKKKGNNAFSPDMEGEGKKALILILRFYQKEGHNFELEPERRGWVSGRVLPMSRAK